MIRKYRKNRVSESRSPRRRMMKESYGVYDLIDYFDVWGNEEDGWDVNNLAKVEEGIYIDDSLSDEEIVDYLIDEVGFFSPSARGKIEVDSSTGDFIEFFNADTYEPLGRLERTRTVNESYRESRKRGLKESKFDDVQYIVDILNDMYGLSNDTDEKFYINSAYGKGQLALRNNDSGSIKTLCNFVPMSSLYEVANAIYNVKSRLG